MEDLQLVHLSKEKNPTTFMLFWTASVSSTPHPYSEAMGTLCVCVQERLWNKSGKWPI